MYAVDHVKLIYHIKEQVELLYRDSSSILELNSYEFFSTAVGGISSVV